MSRSKKVPFALIGAAWHRYKEITDREFLNRHELGKLDNEMCTRVYNTMYTPVFDEIGNQ